jgi:hypothetical protein
VKSQTSPEENNYFLDLSNFKYAFYISYQGSNDRKEGSLVYQVAKKLQSDLEAELSMYFEENEGGVYLDQRQLNGENIIDIEVLKQSMQMICIWTPNYFSKNFSTCAREYRTMEIREGALNKLLPTDNRLIAPLILRAKKHIPAALEKYKCIDICGFEIRKNKLIYPGKYEDICRRLVEDVYDLSLKLKSQSVFSCPNLQDNDFQKWLTENLSP